VKRRGYSIFQRNGAGPWYVAWTDGTGRRRTVKASHQKAVADQIGKAKAAQADRVRTGVVTHAEATAAEAAKETIGRHVTAWEKAQRAKGVTDKHVDQNVSRVTKLLKAAKVTTLSGIEPGRIQTALGTVKTPQTARHYLTALRAFVKWCTETDRLVRSPILAVKKPAVAGQTFQRQALSDAEVFALIEATRTRKTRTPFVGEDRAMYYTLLAYTGLRKSEAASLTPEAFNFGTGSITLAAAYSKHRRQDTLSIPPQISGRLAMWMMGKASGRPVFNIPKQIGWNGLFRRDCRAAGITVKPGCRLGLHSLRRWFITGVGRSGGLAVAQRLARHSTPKLTAGYMDLTINDTDAALAKLPGATVEPQQGRKQA